MNWQIERRSFLRSVAGPLLPLPFLNLMEQSLRAAVTNNAPLRFVTLFKPNGVHPPSWKRQHLAVAPKGLSLLYGVARVLIENHWVDHEFIERSTTGFGFQDLANAERLAPPAGSTIRADCTHRAVLGECGTTNYMKEQCRAACHAC